MNAAVLEHIDLPDSQGSLTLYDWMAEEVCDGRNLIRTDEHGHEMWRARPIGFEVGQRDFFTQVRWDGVSLIAWTWSSYRGIIDLLTGEFTAIEFTK